MNEKIETVHLALFEQKTIMVDRRSKYYEQQVQALREAQDEVVPEAPGSGREMVLNLSVRINEIQAQEMISTPLLRRKLRRSGINWLKRETMPRRRILRKQKELLLGSI